MPLPGVWDWHDGMISVQLLRRHKLWLLLWNLYFGLHKCRSAHVTSRLNFGENDLVLQYSLRKWRKISHSPVPRFMIDLSMHMNLQKNIVFYHSRPWLKQISTECWTAWNDVWNAANQKKKRRQVVPEGLPLDLLWLSYHSSIAILMDLSSKIKKMNLPLHSIYYGIWWHPEAVVASKPQKWLPFRRRYSPIIFLKTKVWWFESEIAMNTWLLLTWYISAFQKRYQHHELYTINKIVNKAILSNYSISII